MMAAAALISAATPTATCRNILLPFSNWLASITTLQKKIADESSSIDSSATRRDYSCNSLVSYKVEHCQNPQCKSNQPTGERKGNNDGRLKEHYSYCCPKDANAHQSCSENSEQFLYSF